MRVPPLPSPQVLTAPAERASPGGWIPSQRVTTEPGREQARVGARARPLPAVVVVQSSCTRVCDPMDCSTPGFPVLHHLPELAPTRVIPLPVTTSVNKKLLQFRETCLLGVCAPSLMRIVD